MIVQQSLAVAPAKSAPEERPARPVAASAAEAPAVKADAPPQEAVKHAAQVIGRALQSLSRSLEFSIDESSGKTVVRVVDAETGGLIRQMPSQEALDIARAIDRLPGLLLRQKA
jgi:flagellar protein FlaG